MIKFTCLKRENEYYFCVREVHKTSRIKIIMQEFSRFPLK